MEKDPKRFEVLRTRITKYAGAKYATEKNLVNDDFILMAKKPQKCDYICIDTSCSGTGNAEVAENDPELKQMLSKCVLKEDYKEMYMKLGIKLRKKIAHLSSFQGEILAAALAWPDVKGVLYSTCSIFPAENEDVVAGALELHPEFELVKLSENIGHEGFTVFFATNR